MLGKIIKVKVDRTKRGYVSKVGVSVYCGHVATDTADNIYNKSVYLIMKDDPGTNYNGVIIGVLNGEDNEDMKIIVAPKGHIYYDPQIREIISKIKNQTIHSLKCRYEKSCGAVVVNLDDEDFKVLLVKNKNGMTWGFPKGHIKRGETEYQTALREVKEETGLDVEIIKGFRQSSDYYSFGSAKKRVVLFLAISKTKNVTLQLDELNSYAWVRYEQAIKMFEYKNNIAVLNQAFYFLNKKQISYKQLAYKNK